MGGVVAFEMACQLIARGEEVEQFAVLDVFAPGRGPGSTGGGDRAVDDAELRAWFARDLAGLLGKPLPAAMADLPAGVPLPLPSRGRRSWACCPPASTSRRPPGGSRSSGPICG